MFSNIVEWFPAMFHADVNYYKEPLLVVHIVVL